MAFNLDWLFKDEESINGKKDQRKDPLEVDRKSMRDKELPLVDEEVTEEEKRVLENDPETVKMYKLFNDFSADAGFYGSDKDILDEVTNEDAFDYGEGNLNEHSGQKYNPETKTEENEISFDDRDIIADRIKEYKEHNKGIVQEKNERKHNDNLDYSLSEFKLMEDAYKFKTLVNKETQDLLEKERPISKETRQPITENELASVLKKYYMVKEKKNWGDYTASELNFMKQCSNWNRINKESGRKNPIMERGQALTQKQIDELADEYTKLRNEKPEEFADLKVEDGKWNKGDFVWKEERFEGQKQYSHFENKTIIGRDGKKQKLTTKYIIKNPPLGFVEGEMKNAYFTIGKNFRTKKGFGITYIDLKRPYPFKEIKEKRA